MDLLIWSREFSKPMIWLLPVPSWHPSCAGCCRYLISCSFSSFWAYPGTCDSSAEGCP